MTEELPKGWSTAKIGDICDINPRRYDVPATEEDVVSFVPMASVEAGTGRLDASQTRSYAEVSRKSLTPFQEGDVIFSKITPCMENGKIALAQGLHGGRAVGSTEFMVLRCSGAVEPKFLLHFLLQSQFKKEAERNMSGAVGQRRVPKLFISESLVPLPPLDEQHRIVSALEAELSRVDAASQQLVQAEARLVNLRSRLIEETCLGWGRTSDSSAQLAPAGVDDGMVPGLPAGWTWKRLHEIADVVAGVTKDSKKQSDPNCVEVPYLRVANVQKGALDLDRVNSIRVSLEKASKLELIPGDVLLNEGGDRDKLGRGWIWEGQIPGCIHQNHVFRARVKNETIHPKLLSWNANEFGQRWCQVNGKQSVNLASISLSKIKLLPVPVPPVEEQGELVKRLEDALEIFDRTAEQLEAARAKADTFRQALLTVAFTGKLVSQDPSEEAASVFLDRIQTELAVKSTTHPKRRRRAGPSGPPSAITPISPVPDPQPVPSGEQTALEF